MERGCGQDAQRRGSSSRPAWVGQGRRGSLLTATAATAASLGLPEERHPCRRDWGLSLLPHDLSFGQREAAYPPQGSSLGSSEDRTAPRGGRRGPQFPSTSLRSELSPPGQGMAELGWWSLGRAVRAPLGLGGDLGRRWLALKWDPRMVFQLWEGRQDKEGSSQLCFPRMSPRGRRHMPMILIIFFFLRNIITTEHELGFNSSLVTRGAAGCAGMAALG